MRDILNDLGEMLSDTDPVRRAQIKSKRELPKRFYEHAEVAPAGERFAIHLDGRPIRTPARLALELPTRNLAELVREEWEAQDREIDPTRMPVTRLVNTALDGIVNDKQAVIEDIIRFAGTDLLCYRADAPQGLVDRQNELWDPVIDWARSSLGARFVLAEGVMHVEQPRETISAFGIHVAAYDSPDRPGQPTQLHDVDRFGPAGDGGGQKRADCRGRLDGGPCRRRLEHRPVGRRCRGCGASCLPLGRNAGGRQGLQGAVLNVRAEPASGKWQSAR